MLDLLALSTEYKIDKLKNICNEAIEAAITIENCSLILKKATEIGDISSNLKTNCMDYILEHY